MRISHFLARVLNKLHLLSLFNAATVIRVNKKKFTIPLLGRQGYDNLNLSEPWMSETLLGLRSTFNGYFVDVGVNIGQTLLKAHAVFDEVDYIGFEPNPSCVQYVQELVRQNGMKKTVVLPVAVGAKTEMLRLNFFATDKSDSSATIVENFKGNTKPDHFIPNRSFSILKIDVEGAEMEVLLGLHEWISEFCPMILLEILPVYSSENRSRLDRQRKIEELLTVWNYKIARIKKKDKVHLELIETIGIHSNIEDCDYLLYHSSLSDKISACFNTVAA
jgi:FkbM family methyltransferase